MPSATLPTVFLGPTVHLGVARLLNDNRCLLLGASITCCCRSVARGRCTFVFASMHERGALVPDADAHFVVQVQLLNPPLEHTGPVITAPPMPINTPAP
eukprot:scaffold4800_cov327-Prasinococcus_capsulatus_cf.AAC.4